MNISAPFIKRPVATTLLTVGLALAGILAFRFLPVSPLPQVDFPTIQVTASLPGAEPETMATSVAAPLERQFGRIAGVTEMTSASYRGATRIVLQFELNRNIDGAARDVQAAINAARSYLPTNLPSNPTYRKVNPADAPILILALTSDTADRAKMYDAASTILQQKLSQVEGVGTVFVGGGSLPAVRVELNPTVVHKYGIGLEDVRSMLASTNTNRPKGQIADATTSREIRTNDQLFKAAEYRDLIVTFRNGAPIHLKDLGDVVDSVEDVRTEGLLNGKTAVMVVIFRSPGANIIETVDRIRGLLPQLSAAIPGGYQPVTVTVDRSPPIRSSLKDVEHTLVISGTLVILVVFAFLRSFRATLIPGVAVPVSLIGTFGVMYLLGLQPGQPLPHGPHHRHGLCGGRRHRGDREHYPLYRKGGEAISGGAAGGQGDRLHGYIHEHLTGGGLHSPAVDGRHGGAPVPRVRRGPVRGDPGLSGALADHHPHDVRHFPPVGERTGSRAPLPRQRRGVRIPAPHL